MTNEEHQREFIELVVEYPNPDLCTYPEYRGKPYFSIKYREYGKYIVGYGSYKIEMISQWIKEYFMPSVQPKLSESEDCISKEDIKDYLNNRLKEIEKNFKTLYSQKENVIFDVLSDIGRMALIVEISDEFNLGIKFDMRESEETDADSN